MQPLWGDHTIALRLLRAMHRPAPLRRRPRRVGYVLRRPLSTHGTPFRLAAEEGLPLDDRNIHVGTRGPLYAASDLCNERMLGFAAVIDRVRARLGEPSP